MTFLPPGDVPSEFGPDNPAGFMAGLVQEGESAASAYQIFHDAGGHMQESRWNLLYGQVANTVAQTPEMLALDPFQLPGPADYGEFQSGAGGKYATSVDLQLFDRDLGAYITNRVTYFSADPHTPAEAAQWAINNFDPANTGADYNQILDGALAVHLWKTVPYEG